MTDYHATISIDDERRAQLFRLAAESTRTI